MRLLPGGNMLATLAIGAGVLIAAPAVMGVVGGILRPVYKATLKTVLLGFDTVKEVGVRTWETIEDLTAEAKTEIQRG
jgi:hypothetical protein